LSLAVVIAPLKGELLSSWVLRSCHANATSLYSLLWHHNLSNHSQIDIDQARSNFYNWLAVTLNHPEGKSGVEVMSLHPIHQLAELFPKRSWVRGIDRRAIKWRSFRFCPVCLQEDKQPYFRRFWRLEWHEFCPIHYVTMHNGCLNCGKPVILHKVSWEKAHLAHCFNCGLSYSSLSSSPITINSDMNAAIHGLYNLISKNLQQDYAAVHFLEAFLEQGRRLDGVKVPCQALNSIGIKINIEYATRFPALFLATSAYLLWFQNKELLDDFILEHQGWFNLAARDYSCPEILKPFHRVGFRVHELNESIIKQVAKEIHESGWEPTPARIARKIGCHVSRIDHFLRIAN